MASRPWTSLRCTLCTAIYLKKSISARCGFKPGSLLTTCQVVDSRQVLVLWRLLEMLKCSRARKPQSGQMSSCVYNVSEEFLCYCLFANFLFVVGESSRKLPNSVLHASRLLPSSFYSGHTVNKNSGSFSIGCTSKSVKVKVLFPSGKLQNHMKKLLWGRRRT